MKRLVAFFNRVDLGYWLLVAVGINLMAGVLVTTFCEAEFKQLNSMLLSDWLAAFSSRPALYGWIVTLCLLLALLALNTLVCTTGYVRNVIHSAAFGRKFGIILFHVAFIVALGGHFLSEFTGINTAVVLEQGRPVAVAGTDLELETLAIAKESLILNGKDRVRRGLSAHVQATGPQGETTDLALKALHPQFARGYAFHLSFMDKGLKQNQARLIVRRDYGLFGLLLAGILAAIAIGCYLPGRIKR